MIKLLRYSNRIIAISSFLNMMVETGEDIHYSEQIWKIATLLYTDYALSGKKELIPELLMNTFAAGNVFGRWLRATDSSLFFDFSLHMSNIIATCFKDDEESAEKSVEQDPSLQRVSH